MKIILAIAAVLLITTVPASAKTLNFPNKESPMFQITIPDSWEPDKDEDEVVEATSPKENISLSIWEITTEEELKNFGKDIGDTLEDHAKEIKLVGEPKKITPAGMEGLMFEGSAIDKEDDHAIQFLALFLISKSAKKVAVVYIEANADTPKKEMEKLVEIMKSIKPPAKK